MATGSTRRRQRATEGVQDEDAFAAAAAKAGPPIPHPTVAEREAAGKEARAAAPRGTAGDWAPADGRDPLAILAAQAPTRVADLVPIRYGRMMVSPFTFYRGAAAVMSADLAGMPRSGLTVQLCGDAHLANFGVFAAPDRELVFDLNDFDETLPGPFEWDVKRLAASMVVAAQDRAIGRKGARQIVLDTVGAYRTAIRTFAPMRTLDIWYARMDEQAILDAVRQNLGKKQGKVVAKRAQKVRSKDSLRALDKLTQTVDGEPRLRSDPPLLVPIDELIPNRADVMVPMRGLMRTYRESLRTELRHLLERYRLVDVGRKVVGVGSVGTRCWIALMLGRDDSDPLFLQIKEAQQSVLAPHLGRSRYANEGRRVVEGQRVTQAAGDILLGWMRVEGIDNVERDFYVRQLWDMKGSAALEEADAEYLSAYGRLCGWALARAHARSGDPVAIASYLGAGDGFDRAMAAFSEAYAEVNERDHAALVDAVEAGRIEAKQGL